MKQYILFAVLLFFSHSCNQTNLEKKQLDEFNIALGKKNVNALELGIISFNKFLNENFNEKKTEKEKIIEFLSHYSDTSYILNNYRLNHVLNNKAIKAFEESGLRKSVWLYGFEMDSVNEEFIKPIEPQGKNSTIKDSLRRFNREGNYYIALYSIEKPDSLLNEYIETKEIVDFIASDIMTSGLTFGLKHRKTNYEILKRVIVIELYYDMIIWYEKREKSSAHNKRLLSLGLMMQIQKILLI